MHECASWSVIIQYLDTMAITGTTPASAASPPPPASPAMPAGAPCLAGAAALLLSPRPRPPPLPRRPPLLCPRPPLQRRALVVGPTRRRRRTGWTPPRLPPGCHGPLAASVTSWRRRWRPPSPSPPRCLSLPFPSLYLCGCGRRPTTHHLLLRHRALAVRLVVMAEGPERELGGWPVGRSWGGRRFHGAPPRRSSLRSLRRWLRVA